MPFYSRIYKIDSYIGDKEIALIADTLKLREYCDINLSSTIIIYKRGTFIHSHFIIIINFHNIDYTCVENRIGPDGTKALIEQITNDKKLWWLDLSSKYILISISLKQIPYFQITSFVTMEQSQFQS